LRQPLYEAKKNSGFMKRGVEVEKKILESQGRNQGYGKGGAHCMLGAKNSLQGEKGALVGGEWGVSVDCK